MTKATPRVLVVGAGVMGSFHARVVAQSPRAELAGVVDIREASGSELAQKFDTRWFASLPDLQDVDAVIVATPTEGHFEIAQNILSTDTALLLEKPLTSNLETTNQLINQASKSSVPLMCGFLERYNPAILTAQQIVREPIHFSARRHSPYTPRIMTGVSWDLLIHDVDLISRFTNYAKPQSVAGNLGYFHPNSSQGSEDAAECVISFEPGIIAHASASRLGHQKIRTLSITELDRVVEVDLLRKDVTIYRNVDVPEFDVESRGYRQQTAIEIPEIVSSQEPLTTQFNRFMDLIQGIADPAEELSTLAPAHEIVQALQN